MLQIVTRATVEMEEGSDEGCNEIILIRKHIITWERDTTSVLVPDGGRRSFRTQVPPGNTTLKARLISKDRLHWDHDNIIWMRINK